MSHPLQQIWKSPPLWEEHSADLGIVHLQITAYKAGLHPAFLRQKAAMGIK